MDKDDIKNYYEVLEISQDASDRQIHQSYIKAKSTYSEESAAMYSLMTKDECRDMLGLIEEAYSVLGVSIKRKAYDTARGFNKGDIKRLETVEHNAVESTKEDQQEVDESDMSFYILPDKDKKQRSKDLMRTREDFNINENKMAVSKVSAKNQYSLEYDKNDEFEQKIENEVHFTGAFLKDIREYKNVTIERMADLTKISRTYLRHIENDDYGKLPAFVFIRGFVFQYGKCLKLSPNLVATSYMDYLKKIKDDQQVE